MPHISGGQFDSFRNHTLASDELAEVAHHLAECAACAEALRPAAQRDATVARLRLTIDYGELRHLDYETLEKHVDGKLQGARREVAEAHVALCGVCAGEAGEIARFFEAEAPRAGVNNVIEVRPIEPAAPPGPGTPTDKVGEIGLEKKKRRSRHRTSQWVAIATTIAVFISIGLVVTWVYLLRKPEPAAADKPRVTLRDAGFEIGIDSKGHFFGLRISSAPLLDALTTALSSERMEIPRGLRGLGVQQPGGLFFLVAPLGVTVESDTPTLKWTRLGGASSYIVTILDEQFRTVAQSRPVKDTQWTVEDPLKRGVLYAWRVTAPAGDLSIAAPKLDAPNVRFRVLAQPDKVELDQYRRTVGGSHLAMAVLYLRYGMIDEAEQEARALRDANPETDNVAARLYRGLDPKTRDTF